MSLVFTANSKPEAVTAGYVGQEMQLLFHYFLIIASSLFSKTALLLDLDLNI